MSTPNNAAPVSSAPVTTPTAPVDASPVAASKGTPAVPSKTTEEMFTLKINGKDRQMTRSQIIAAAQQSEAATQKMQAASQKNKEAEALWEMLDKDPAEVLKRRGKDARKWAEEYLLEHINNEKMTPEQKKSADNAKRLQEYEAKEKRAKDDAHKKQLSDLESKHAQNYTTIFVDALNKSGLPKTEFTMKRMAQLQMTNIQKKLELTSDQLASVVKKDYIEEQKALFGAMEGDSLMDSLGPELMKKLQKAQLAKLKGGKPSFNATPKQQVKEKSGKSVDWKSLQKKYRG